MQGKGLPLSQGRGDRGISVALILALSSQEECCPYSVVTLAPRIFRAWKQIAELAGSSRKSGPHPTPWPHVLTCWLRHWESCRTGRVNNNTTESECGSWRGTGVEMGENRDFSEPIDVTHHWSCIATNCLPWCEHFWIWASPVCFVSCAEGCVVCVCVCGTYTGA